jgi:hypothetical protein
MLREGSVCVGRIRGLAPVAILAMYAALAGCASSGPAHFGQYNDLAPKVAATKGERVPLHLTVQLAKPANVAVFLVAPGRASTLLFPQDSTQPGFVEAGAHLVETSFAKGGTLADSSRMIRRPGEPQPTQQQGNRNNRNGRSDLPTFGFNQHGYLLIYASQDPLPYATLASKVAGISVPIDDTDALNTVTKLVRATTHTTGRWAAFATDFPP